jgi:hypothetical protein
MKKLVFAATLLASIVSCNNNDQEVQFKKYITEINACNNEMLDLVNITKYKHDSLVVNGFSLEQYKLINKQVSSKMLVLRNKIQKIHVKLIDDKILNVDQQDACIKTLIKLETVAPNFIEIDDLRVK